MDQEQLQYVVKKVITEEIGRFKQDFIRDWGRLIGSAAECGCLSQIGCCEQQGCCSQQGCCAKSGSLLDMVNERIDILEDFILSNKEPISRFFKARGVELGF